MISLIAPGTPPIREILYKLLHLVEAIIWILYVHLVEAITQKWSAVGSYIRQRKESLVDCVKEVHTFYELFTKFAEYLTRVEHVLDTIHTTFDTSEAGASLELEKSHEEKQREFANLQTHFNKVKKLFFYEHLKQFELDYEAHLFRWTNINLKLCALSSIHKYVYVRYVQCVLSYPWKYLVRLSFQYLINFYLLAL